MRRKQVNFIIYTCDVNGDFGVTRNSTNVFKLYLTLTASVEMKSPVKCSSTTAVINTDKREFLIRHIVTNLLL